MSQQQNTAKGKCKNDAMSSAPSKPDMSVVPTLMAETPVYNRYYHMFANGELKELTVQAAEELGLAVGPRDTTSGERCKGIEIVQEGWERSNYYVELRCWVS